MSLLHNKANDRIKKQNKQLQRQGVILFGSDLTAYTTAHAPIARLQ